MSNKDLKEIKISDLKNDRFLFSQKSENLVLQKGKINFIYANNGVGKTTIYDLLQKQILQKQTKIEFYPLDLYENSFLEENKNLVISLHIEKINKLKSENEKIKLKIQENIKNWIKGNEFSTGNTTAWTKHIKLYLQQEMQFSTLTSLVRSKNENNNFQIDLNTILELDKELKNKIITEQKNNLIQLDLNKISKNSKEKCNDILSLSDTILNNIKEIKNNSVKKIEEKFSLNYNGSSINIKFLSCIVDCLNTNSLEKMNDCYLCKQNIFPDDSSSSNKFQELKKYLNNEVEKLKKEFDEPLKISENLEKFDRTFSTNLGNLFLEVNYENILNDNIKNEIEKTIANYKYSIEKNLFEIKNILKESDIKKIKENLKEITKLNNEKKLNDLLSEEDFNIACNIIYDIIGKNKIKINKNSENIIEIFANDFETDNVELDEYDNELPLSSGETKLVRFIFNLFIYVSNKNINDYKNNFLIIDETEELFDDLNRINICYIINLFLNYYKVNFIIFTNKYLLIKELWHNLGQNIELTLFFKDIEDKRLFKKTLSNKNSQENEIQFLGLKDGLKLLKNSVVQYLKSVDTNKNDKTLIFLYICWLLRINNLIFKNKNNDDEPIELLKYGFLLNLNSSSDAKIFNESLKDIKEFLELNESENFILFDEFVKSINFIKIELKEIKMNILENYPIVQNNIINLIKILFLREKIKMFIDSKIKNKKSKKSYSEKIDLLIGSENPDSEKKETFKTIKYILNLLNYFYHNESNPSLLLKGIELNKIFVNALIDKTEKIINQEQSNE